MLSGKKTKKRQQLQQRQIKQPVGSNQPSASIINQGSLPLPDTLTALVLIIVIGLLVYSNTFNVPFVFDDRVNILENPFIRVTHITIDELKGVLSSPSPFRPLANLTFALNYCFHQYDVTGYHIVNTAIHLITAFLIFLITRQTLRLCRMENTWIAIPVALLWLVNPVHTQSITYIVQRMNSLAAMLYMLAMVCYIQGRLFQRRSNAPSFRPALFFTAAGLAWLLSLLSKQITATLPVMLFLYEWYFFRDLDRDWFKKQRLWMIVMSIILTVIVLIYLKGSPLEELASLYAKKEFTPSQRLLTEPGVVVYYLSLLFFPSPDRLRIFYQLTPANSLFSPASTLLSIAALAGLIAAALFLRHRDRLFSFVIAWFLINLVIESSIIPVALVFEHRTYLPSVFIFVPLVVMLFRRTTAGKALVLISAAIILCGSWTWQRNAAWTDIISFWNDAAMKKPGDPEMHNSLGLAYREKGDLEAAITSFTAALDQDSTYAEAYNNIGMTLVELRRQSEAIPFLEKAILLKPDFDKAHYNLGLALKNLGQTDKAESNYATALELNPLYKEAHINIGNIKMDRGQPDEAMTHFKRVLAIDPYYEKAYISMGIACFRKGETDRALTYIKKALALNPGSAEAAGKMDAISQTLKQYGQVIARLQQARQQRPDDPEITIQLAAVCQQASMVDLAVDLYEQALSLDPKCERCLNGLAGLYLAAGRYKQALPMLEQLALLYPEKANIFYGLACAYAQDNQKEKAVENLKKSVARGFDNIDYIRRDENLRTIRDTDYFQSLTAGGKN